MTVSQREQVLGQLLLMQSFIGVLPDEASIARFVCKGLQDVPGVQLAECLTETDAARAEEPGRVTFSVRLGQAEPLRLLLTLSDPLAFAPYEEFVRNFGFMLAIVLEERGQRRLIQQHHRLLEQRVEQRTAQLRAEIAERTAAEKELSESRRMLRVVLNTIPQRVFWKDLSLRYLGCNRAFCDDAGLTETEAVIGKTDAELFTAQDASLYRTDDREVLETGRAKPPYEEPLTRADGSKRCIRTSKEPLLDQDGKIIGVLGVYEDITELKLAENALRRTEDKAQQYLNIVEVMILALDEHGRVTLINRKGLQLLGYQASEVLGKSWIEMCVPPEQRDKLQEFYRWAMEDKALSIAEHQNDVLTKSGQRRSIAWHNHLLRDEQTGRIVGMLSSGDDVTEKKLLEEALRHSQKLEAIGRLAGGVAHDFNNLLTCISGNVSLALLDLTPDDALFQPLSEVNHAAESAAALTKQLLAFSRKQIIEPKVLGLNDTLESLSQLLKRLLGEQIRLEMQPAPETGAVRADPGQLEQVLVNLVVNARDAMPQGGTLTVRTSNIELDEESCRAHPPLAPGAYVTLEVSDTGTGISAEVKEHLFEPFFTTKEKGKGTGLGLATVFGAVQQHGGSIEVHSELGKGSVFCVYLPRVFADPELSPRVKPNSGDLPMGHETVLVAEDDPAVLQVAKRFLKMLGYTVLPHPNGYAALRAAEQYHGPIQLLLTDVIMPGMNGRELAEAVKKIRPKIKVLYCSGYTEDAIVHQSHLDEGISFIGKPYTPQALATKIRKVLDG